jgi:4-hydroxy-tetrahydrodipicolinate reductase
VVCGTTGWYDALPRVRAAVDAAGTGLVYAPNFSLGVALFSRLVRDAARRVDALDDYDVFLHEAHHRHKADHPSGTARALADDVVRAMNRKRDWREGPSTGTADAGTLWVSVTRAGEIPGTHVFGLEGPDDRLELRHEARGRSGFARGALEAARWIHGRTGVFTLDDLLADRFEL